MLVSKKMLSKTTKIKVFRLTLSYRIPFPFFQTKNNHAVIFRLILFIFTDFSDVKSFHHVRYPRLTHIEKIASEIVLHAAFRLSSLFKKIIFLYVNISLFTKSLGFVINFREKNEKESVHQATRVFSYASLRVPINDVLLFFPRRNSSNLLIKIINILFKSQSNV